MYGKSARFEQTGDAPERSPSHVGRARTRVHVVGRELLLSVAVSLGAVAWLSGPEPPADIRVVRGRFGAQLIESAISRSGEVLATTDSQGKVTVRYARLGWEIARVLDAPHFARAVALSPDGHLLAHGGPSEGVTIWDVESKGKHRELPVPVRGIRALEFDHTGRKLAAASQVNGRIAIWNFTERRAEIIRAEGPGVMCLTFSPDGSTLVSGGRDGSVTLWDLNTGLSRLELDSPGGPAVDVVFSPDGRLIAAASSLESRVRIWESHTGKLCGLLNGHRYGVTSVAFSPGGDMLASAGGDEKVRLWNTATGRQCGVLEGENGFPDKVVFLPDCQTLIGAGTSDDDLRIWTLGADLLNELRPVPRPGDTIRNQ
jgi:WD40 repeat protein